MLIALPFKPGHFVNIDHIAVIEPVAQDSGSSKWLTRLILSTGRDYLFTEDSNRLAAHIAEAIWHKCNPTLNRKGPA